MSNAPPTTVRPDLIGKTIVVIHDPRAHAEGRIPPFAYLGSIIAAEADYAAIECLGFATGLISPNGFRGTMRLHHDYERFEPGERLETYLPGYGSVFGTPDFVHFQGRGRERWDRDQAPQTGA